MSTSREVFSFYPSLNQSGAHMFDFIFQMVNNNQDVDHAPYDFVQDMPGYRVRVPVIMLLLGAQGNPQVVNHFQNNYRRQFMGHVYANAASSRLAYIDCVWNGWPRTMAQVRGRRPNARTYSCNPPANINSIYSCFRAPLPGDAQDCPAGAGFAEVATGAAGPSVLDNMLDYSPKVPTVVPANYGSDPAGPELVLGIAFGRSDIAHRRSYSRSDRDAPRNMQANDITTEFIEGALVTEQHYGHNQFRQYDTDVRGEYTIALYVCRGARLEVHDDRYGSTNQRHRMSHSLYQQGSLVVVCGRFSIHYGCAIAGNTPYETSWRHFTEILIPRARSQRNIDAFESQHDDSQGLDNRTVAQQKRLVIFLGAAESQHSSVTWRLNVVGSFASLQADGQREDNYGPIRFQSYLNFPENGMIVDVTTWNAGFELIRLRHHYEQLHESVIEAPDDFNWPEFRVPASDYLRRRLLGICLPGEWGPMKIAYPYGVAEDMAHGLDVPAFFYTDNRQNDDDVRRYIGCLRETDADPGRYMIEQLRGLQLSDWTFQDGFMNLHSILKTPAWAPPFYPAVVDLNYDFHYVDPQSDTITLNTANGKYRVSSFPNLWFELKYLLPSEVGSQAWIKATDDNVAVANQAMALFNIPGKAPERVGPDVVKYVQYPSDPVPMFMYLMVPYEPVKLNPMATEFRPIGKQ